MDLRDFIKNIKGLQRRFWLIVASVFLLGFIYTVVQPLKFGATSQLLILQNSSAQVDSYAMSRSNEYLSTTLASVITTNSFYNEVMNAGFNIDQNYFGTDARGRKKTWENAIEAKALADSGVLEVSVYHTDRYQLDQLAQAVNQVLRTKHGLYHGGGSSVYVRVINDPIASTWPVKPNVVVNLIGGLFVGILLGLIYVYLFGEEIIKNDVGQKINFIKPTPEYQAKPTPVINQNNNIARQAEYVKPETMKPIETPKVENIVSTNIKTIDPIKPEDIIKHGDINNVF